MLIMDGYIMAENICLQEVKFNFDLILIIVLIVYVLQEYWIKVVVVGMDVYVNKLVDFIKLIDIFIWYLLFDELDLVRV